jgi:predicted molibdopterin-dependent oxidoreductase YjgC
MMPDRRIKIETRRGRRFEIEVDGRKVLAYEGETIAAVLLAAEIRVSRLTPRKHEPRGVYCGIGICHECVMVVNGMPDIRICQTLATPGCKVATQKGLGEIEKVERS